MDDLILELFDKKCIQFGKFTLKSKVTSPIYIDFKAVITYPNITSKIVHEFFKLSNNISLEFDRVCGVPYGGIVFCSLFSQLTQKPMLIVRKETKKYGMKKLIEGEFNNDEKILLIEDIVSTGKSVLEFVNKLEKQKLKINDVFVICDRRLFYTDKLKNIKVHSLFTIHQLLNVLFKNDRISKERYLEVYQFILSVNIDNKPRSIEYIKENVDTPKKLKIVNTILNKKTNICLKCYETDFFNLCDILGKAGDHIAFFLFDSSIIIDFTHEKYLLLKKISTEKNVILFDNIDINTNNEIVKKKLYNCEADIVSITGNFNEAYNALKELKNKSLGFIVNLGNNSDNFEEYTNSQILEEFLMGIYLEKRSVLMPNDMILYFTDFTSNKPNEPILLRNLNKCDIFTISYDLIKFSNSINLKLKEYKEIFWKFIN